MPDHYLSINPEVEAAIQDDQPVVALESTIIAHGMPFPKNAETALTVEQEIRKAGAIPATIGVINGKMTIGMSTDQISDMGKSGQAVQKVSRRDLPYIIATKLTGATTVASTMIGASWAGIKIFATGGIGGVHRGAETTMDISADLEELAKTNVAVVCAGAKSVLDIGLTLEYLETKGVPVVGYQTKGFPAFYLRESGFEADFSIQTPGEIANLLDIKWTIGLNGGVVIGNPIPRPFEMDKVTIDSAIELALTECSQKEITGKAVTPYLLERIEQITGGVSLESNIQLVLNNARLAAAISVAFFQ
ncbi:MAG: pseudouridine-5'-phosphate glycosidase [Bacteroidota bacterium]